MNVRTQNRPPNRVYLNIEIHPLVRKEMSIAARKADATMIEWLHLLLCRELGRPDLATQVPGASPN